MGLSEDIILRKAIEEALREFGVKVDKEDGCGKCECGSSDNSRVVININVDK